MKRARQRARIAPLQDGRQRRLAPFEDAPYAREQIRAQRRRHREGDNQRREQRDQIGGAERLQQPALDPARKKSGRNTSITITVAKTMELRISRLA